jgi:hypothetical protein
MMPSSHSWALSLSLRKISGVIVIRERKSKNDGMKVEGFYSDSGLRHPSSLTRSPIAE